MVRLYGNGNEKDKEKEKDNKHKLSEAFQVYQNSLLVAHSIGHSVCEVILLFLPFLFLYFIFPSFLLFFFRHLFVSSTKSYLDGSTNCYCKHEHTYRKL